MKRTIPIVLAVLAAGAGTLARAEPPSTYTVVLAGGAAENMMRIWLTPDGQSYVIDSVVPLEVGGAVCHNPPENNYELICQAPLVAGFEVNAGPGNDTVVVARSVEVPVTMRGGPGQDTLVGGDGADKLIGGDGDDRLLGRGGDDLIYAGRGNDVIFGGRGDDTLRGGPGRDRIGPGPGRDDVRQALRRKRS